MTKTKSTKRALLMSALALLSCVAMLVGSTYAWFTDSVTSSGNIIKSGKLDVEMYWAEGNEDPATAVWNDASTDAIFNYDRWEPGYVDAKHLQIANVGNLAFNYRLRFVANGVVSELADVIDVYYFADAKQLTRTDVSGGTYLGTVTEVLGTAKNISGSVNGMLKEGETKEITLALKMQESAGNEYQDLSVCSDFSVELIATQASFESDTFNAEYDATVSYPDAPAALVRPMTELTIDTAGSKLGMDLGEFDLDVGYQFEPTDSLAKAENSEYRYWHADFVVSADNDVPANSLALAGYYEAWCSLNDYKWVALTSPDAIKAGTEIRLVSSMAGGFTVNYEELCNYGNDGIGFRCGAVDIKDSNKGTTLTVELRLYETEEPSEANGNSHNKETGKYIVLGTFTHTFGGEYTTLEDGTVLFVGDDGDVTLYNTADVTATDYAVPAGVTALGDYAFSYNDTIETVTLPESVTALGRAFDSNTTVKTVVLNEGLEQIDSRAFKSTTALEEIVIPSTVKTIADNAFQKSGIRTIVIPATVETIGETAFGASKIETVIIEGNTSIQGYAFRGCPNLRTVYLKGDDVTFIPSTLNGRNSTWFCNGESNNPNTSDITFYVENNVVAARVKAAMGAEANNTPVIVNGTEVQYVKVASASALSTALNDATAGTTIVVLTADIKEDVAFTQKKSVSLVIDGNGKKMENASFSITARADTDDSATLTIKNFNFTTTDASRTFIESVETNYYPNNVTISNCTFEGTGAGSDVLPVSVKSANNLVIENCKANNVHSLLQNTSGWNLTVKNCEVTNAGRGMSLGTVQGATIENVKIDAGAEKYGIRMKAAYSVTTTIKDCEISAFCPVVVRGASANYNLVFDGENTMTAANTDGVWCAIGTSEYETNGSLPTAATGSVKVTLNDTTLNASGIYGAA